MSEDFGCTLKTDTLYDKICDYLLLHVVDGYEKDAARDLVAIVNTHNTIAYQAPSEEEENKLMQAFNGG